jgi:hypothetical protein
MRWIAPHHRFLVVLHLTVVFAQGEFMNSRPTQLNLLQRDWVNDSIPVVVDFARSVPQFTSDDLHGLLPEPTEKNWFGVMLAVLKNTGRIQRVGYQPSERPEANGRPIAVWRLK